MRIASHRGGDGCRRAHTEASTQTAPVDEPPVTDFVTPAPAVPHVAPVAVFKYVSPAPVIECVAPPVGSLPPYEVFSAPVCNQVHQELFAASEMTENNAEIHVLQEQVIVQEIRCGVPAVFQAASPVVEHRAPAPGVQAPTLVEENIAHAPAVLHSPTPVVECTAPAPAVIHSPTPVVESVAPAPALSESPAPGVEHISPAPSGLFPVPMVANIAPEPPVSHSPAPVLEHFSPAPVVSSAHRGHEEAVPRVTLLLRMGMDGRRFRVSARRSRPLWPTFDAFCTRLGLQVSQVRFFFGELSGLSISPSDTPDQVGLVDGDLLVAQEEFEEDDDDDYDEIDGTESRFPAGFRPMRMCRWFPSAPGTAGRGGVYVRSLGERAAPLARGQGL